MEMHLEVGTVAPDNLQVTVSPRIPKQLVGIALALALTTGCGAEQVVTVSEALSASVVTCPNPTDDARLHVKGLFESTATNEIVEKQLFAATKTGERDMLHWQQVAGDYGLTVFNTLKQQDELTKLLADTNPKATDEAYLIAKDTMQLYGINLRAPDVPAATDVTGRTKHSGLSLYDNFAIKSALLTIVQTYAHKPKELVDLAGIRVLSVQAIESNNKGLTQFTTKENIIDPYKVTMEQPLADTVNHELGHLLNAALCGSVLATQFDEGLTAHNPDGFTYGRSVQSSEKQPVFLQDVEPVIAALSRQLSQDTLPAGKRARITLDLDRKTAHIFAVEPNSTTEPTEDAATIFEPVLNPKRFDVVRSLVNSGSPLGRKINTMLARLYEKNPKLLMYLMDTGEAA